MTQQIETGADSQELANKNVTNNQAVDADLPSNQTEIKEQPDELPASAEKRIAKLYKEKMLALEELKKVSDRERYLQNELQRYKTTQPTSSSGSERVDPNRPIEPKIEDFEGKNPLLYQKAYMDYQVSLLHYEHQKKQESKVMTERERYLKKISTEHDQRLIETAAKYSDFEDVLQNLNYLDLSASTPEKVADLIYTIQEMPNSGEVTYFLAKHPERAQQLINSNTKAALIELGKISNELHVLTEKPKLSSSAPPPASNVDVKSASIAPNADQNGIPAMDHSEFRKRLLKRKKK